MDEAERARALETIDLAYAALYRPPGADVGDLPERLVELVKVIRDA